MAMLTRHVPETLDRSRRPRNRPGGPVIVASRGDVSSDGAIRLALELAEHAESSLEVLAVLEPVAIVAPEFGALLDAPDGDREHF
jgi:hypothetical protein